MKEYLIKFSKHATFSNKSHHTHFIPCGPFIIFCPFRFPLPPGAILLFRSGFVVRLGLPPFPEIHMVQEMKTLSPCLFSETAFHNINKLYILIRLYF